MVVGAIGNTGTVPREVSTDAGGYWAKAVEQIAAMGVDPYIARGKTRHGTRLPPAPLGRIPKELLAGDRNGIGQSPPCAVAGSLVN